MPLVLLLLASAPAPECAGLGDLGEAQCWSSAFDRADNQLNAIWPDVLAAARDNDKNFVPLHSAKPSAEVDLIEAQRAWLKYRDAECALESDDAQGGTGQAIISAQCATEQTRQRIKQLQDIAAGFREG